MGLQNGALLRWDVVSRGLSREAARVLGFRAAGLLSHLLTLVRSGIRQYDPVQRRGVSFIMMKALVAYTDLDRLPATSSFWSVLFGCKFEFTHACRCT